MARAIFTKIILGGVQGIPAKTDILSIVRGSIDTRKANIKLKGLGKSIMSSIGIGIDTTDGTMVFAKEKLFNSVY